MSASTADSQVLDRRAAPRAIAPFCRPTQKSVDNDTQNVRGIPLIR
jgi:hypothetical protein